MTAPGGASISTAIHTPATPSTAASAIVAGCQVRRRETSSRVVAAGTTISAVASSAPTADSAATATRLTRPSSTPSGTAERTPIARAPAASKPVSVQRGPSSALAAMTATLAPAAQTMSPASMTSRLPNSSVSMFAPEWNTSEARITPAASAATSTSAVTLS